MKFNSSRLKAVIEGDDRHPREIAESMGKSNPEENFPEIDPFSPRMDGVPVFNPEVGALEFLDEGAVLFCEQLKEDV
jgi:hypothetical protein